MPDPLQPRVYEGDVSLAEPPRLSATRRTVPLRSRTPGEPVPWQAACAVAVVLGVTTCVMETVTLLLGVPDTHFGFMLLFMMGLPLHISRPRLRLWALAAALPFFSTGIAVGGYLQAPLLAASVVVYAAVTHIRPAAP